MSDEDLADTPDDVLAAWAKDCKCCRECGGFGIPCGGVSAGGFCDRVCLNDCGRDADDFEVNDLEDEA